MSALFFSVALSMAFTVGLLFAVDDWRVTVAAAAAFCLGYVAAMADDAGRQDSVS